MYLAGIDIGGTKCAVILGKEEGGKLYVIAKEKISSGKTLEPYDTMDKMAHLLTKLFSENNVSAREIGAIGISCGGPLDSKKGIIMRPPNLTLWDDIHIVEYFEDKFNIKTCLCNDANACALAENRFGAGKGSDNMVFLTFGTGLGAGLILDGRLYSGSCDLAGEVGHIRLSEDGGAGFGKRGSFEGWCSGGGIAQLGYIMALEKIQAGIPVAYYKAGENPLNITAKSVAEAAEAGDETAIEVYRKTGEMLGRGLSVLIDILNPETIVIGSVFERSGRFMREAMNKVIEEECISASARCCKVVPAELGDDIGDFAALTLAYEAAKNK